MPKWIQPIRIWKLYRMSKLNEIMEIARGKFQIDSVPRFWKYCVAVKYFKCEIKQIMLHDIVVKFVIAAAIRFKLHRSP